MTTLSATACLTISTGCGGAARPVHLPPADREWIDNTAGVIDQLQRDLQLESTAGDTIAAARETLRTGLYTVLVAYTDFGGCRHMVAAVGVEPNGLARAVEHLQRACVRLQDADRLFTRAVERDAPRLLSRATQEALAAVPSLDAAALELARRT